MSWKKSFIQQQKHTFDGFSFFIPYEINRILSERNSNQSMHQISNAPAHAENVICFQKPSRLRWAYMEVLTPL